MSNDFSELKPVVFKLDVQAWEDFNALLDREPVFMPKLAASLAKASTVFAPEVD